MSQETKEVATISNEAAIVKLADTFEESEKKAILRDMFIVTQIKMISVKEETTDANGYPKTITVKKKMDPFRAMAYVMLCRDLGFNPALNLVTMLEDNFYIGLDAHILYAQKTGLCHGIDAVLEEEKEIEYEKKEYAKGSRTPTISKGKGKYFRYKCTVKKLVGDKIEEFSGIGIASPDNVTGGDKATELKIMQMAEARATRRALKKSFPPGCGHIEDITEYPDYSNAPLLEEPKQEGTGELAKKLSRPSEEVKEEVKEEVAPTPEVKEPVEAPKKAAPAPKKEEKVEEAKKDEPVTKKASDKMYDKLEASNSSTLNDPRYREIFGESETVQEDAPEEVQEDAPEDISSDEVMEQVEDGKISVEEAADMFGDAPPTEFASEEEEKEHYRKLVAEARKEFMKAVEDWKEDKENPELIRLKGEKGDIVASYNKIIISRGWANA